MWAGSLEVEKRCDIGIHDTGYRTDRTELLHALLHFELPRDPESTRNLIRRFRRQQLD